jgi:hypothetical protein
MLLHLSYKPVLDASVEKSYKIQVQSGLFQQLFQAVAGWYM